MTSIFIYLIDVTQFYIKNVNFIVIFYLENIHNAVFYSYHIYLCHDHVIN